MNDDDTQLARAGTARVCEIFSGVLSVVEDWANVVEHAVAERGTDAAVLDEVVASVVRSTLMAPGRMVSGAGFVSGPRQGDVEPWHISWWAVRDDKTGDPIVRREVSAQSGTASRRYTRLEWWRDSISGGRRHLVGPYVDYPGSGDTALSATAPVVSAERIIGIMVADLRLSRLERVVGPVLDSVGHRATIVNEHGRVVLSADPMVSTGDLLLSDDGPGRRRGVLPMPSIGQESARTDDGRLVLRCGGASLAVVV